VEPKAALVASDLRRRYGDRLALVGGMCNALVLPRGSRGEIRAHTLDVLSAGAEGGLVIGSHSIGPDIAVESYDCFIELWRQYGSYPMRLTVATK